MALVMFEAEVGRDHGFEHRLPPTLHRVANRCDQPGILGSVASRDRAPIPHVSQDALLKITNPPVGHSGVVGLKHAERWVRQGRAFFEAGGRLRLLDRHRVALGKSMRRSADVPGGGYDDIRRQMRSNERRHIPIAQPPPRPTKRRMVTAIARAGVVHVVFESGAVAASSTPLPPVIGSFPG